MGLLIHSPRYLSGHAELLRFTSCAHLLQPVPHMIVVEDFRTFFSEYVQLLWNITYVFNK